MPEASSNSPSAPRPLVFVVDDQTIVREPIAACLRTAGYDAVNVAGAAEVLEIVKSRLPDLIILDVHMPGMDGLALLSALRSNTATANVPVILLTVESDRPRSRVRPCSIRRQLFSDQRVPGWCRRRWCLQRQPHRNKQYRLLHHPHILPRQHRPPRHHRW